MLSTIIAVIIALATGTTPANPTKQEPTAPSTETKANPKPKTSSDPAAGTFGGTGQWSENPT